MKQRSGPEQATVEADRIGFFGKLPTHGDFVATGLSRTLQNALDTWLQAGLAQAQHRAGDTWEPLFRHMPAWRFIVERGLWGPATVAGIIAPSRDRVGRCFPLAITTQLNDFADDARKLCLDDTWFIALEAIAETTQQRDFSLETFTGSLKRLRSLRPGDADFPDHPTGAGRRSDTLWWRFDPDDRQTKGFRSGGPPRPADFVSLAFEKANKSTAWDGTAHPPQEKPSPHSAPAPFRNDPRQNVPPEAAVTPPTKASAEPPTISRRFNLSSSEATHAGTRLSVNADALLIRYVPVLFAVVDGVGDGADAGEASRTTVSVLSDIASQNTLETLLQEIKGKLGRAHGLLQASPGAQNRTPPLASVVSLAAVGDSFAVIWVGDARAYLVRDGMMRCLSRDHVAVGLRRSLSRGIGMPGQLSPEVLIDTVQDGDRFLLCSNPLARVLPERSIAEILLSAEHEAAADTLIQEGLIANCRENLSAVVIDVKAGHVR